MTDSGLDTEARRLFASAALSTHAARCLRGRIVPESVAEDLLELARCLGEETNTVERRYRLRFEPPYPGLTAGPESVRGGFRLLLACKASDDEGTLLGVIFTALIPGRPPQVSVAPVETRIPEEWRPLADLF
jgi:hypothetical protein